MLNKIQFKKLFNSKNSQKFNLKKSRIFNSKCGNWQDSIQQYIHSIRKRGYRSPLNPDKDGELDDVFLAAGSPCALHCHRFDDHGLGDIYSDHNILVISWWFLQWSQYIGDIVVIFTVITIYWWYCDIAVIFTVILLKAWPWLKIMPLINLIILPKNT